MEFFTNYASLNRFTKNQFVKTTHFSMPLKEDTRPKPGLGVVELNCKLFSSRWIIE